MYNLRLTREEAVLFRGVLASRLAQLGITTEVEPESDSEISVLTHLISRSHPWQGQVTLPIEVDLSLDELTILDRSMSDAPRFQGYAAPRPAAPTAIQSLRRKVDRARKPASGPFAVLQRLLTGGQGSTM